MKKVETYNDYDIVDTAVGYFLIIESNSYDYVQKPFYSIEEAKKGIDNERENKKEF